MEGSTLFQIIIDVLITVMTFSLLLCAWRLYRGPNTPNRTAAFDLIAIHAVGIFALDAVRVNSSYLLDGAIITAVLGFLGALMFARYLEHADERDWQDDSDRDQSK